VSLRTRVLAGVALVAVLLVCVLVLITRSTQADMVSQVDAQLERSVGPAGGFGDRGPGDGQPPPGGNGGQRPPTPLYIGVLDGDTVRTVVAPNLSGDDTALPEIEAEQVRGALETGEPFTVDSVDADLRYRVRASQEPDGEVVVVALPLDSVDDAIAGLVTVEVLGAVVILAALALVAWWVIRLGIRPVRAMTSAATAIAGGDLSQRVPEADARTEAGELGLALNVMLGRIESSFEERARAEAMLRRFVSDASHELRTPVATIRGYAELYRSGGLRDPDALDDAMRRTEQEAVRMGGLVDDLLHLARLDEGRPMEREAVDLAQVVEDAARDAGAVAPDRTVTARTTGPLPVTGDELRLRQVVANVVGNALVHTPPGTPVELTASEDGGDALVEVTDHGPGMSDQVAARAFERFYRADPARSRHRGGSGLGLAIVHATVAGHGGTTDLSSAPGEGTTVRIRLPLR
jgi:two-component system, OmpR family, sensor kinase